MTDVEREIILHYMRDARGFLDQARHELRKASDAARMFEIDGELRKSNSYETLASKELWGFAEEANISFEPFLTEFKGGEFDAEMGDNDATD